MHHGRVQREFLRAEATPESVVAAASGLATGNVSATEAA
jgi:rhamnose transport system ATP-binding protein